MSNLSYMSTLHSYKSLCEILFETVNECAKQVSQNLSAIRRATNSDGLQKSMTKVLHRISGFGKCWSKRSRCRILMQMWQLLRGLLESRHYADLEPYRNHDCRAVMAACLGVRTAESQKWCFD